MDSYSIAEKRGKHQGSLRVGRLGLHGTITYWVELCRWDFSKKHFFKWFHKYHKILEFSSRSNKGCLFVEISEYRNGERSGCLRVPKGINMGGWAFLETKQCIFFFGKSASRLGKEVAAAVGGHEKSIGNSRNHVRKKINEDMKVGRELCQENQLPNISGTINQKKRFWGFDFFQKSNNPTLLKCSRPLRGPSAKWTQAHFPFKIIVAFDRAA